ncbi:probable tubulin polyglutamylase TTLL9 isoform X4 [Triplophysa dalaica]|uniref:probable tubulin polyglutamylase TTLL9 isoform X4 n=1 Tax=Triplophysa dalaica TaxID=1582913 RepID=UPI0024DF3557|nr:probable tubulin polyglutamylase TTLL9 isoform X4 [Triplophysa dalaica]
MSKNRQTAAHKGYQKKKEGEGRSCIRYRCGLTNTIQDILNHRPGWVEVKEDGEWDFNWCDVGWLRENFDHSYMGEHVRICHFRNHYELTRKNLMVKNLKRYRKTLERESGRLEASKCDFFPRTFELPSEYHIFVEEFKRNPGSTWIMKPVARSQGKGIFLFRKLKDITDWRKDGTRSEEQKEEAQVESYVAQRYIENPYLIAGRKFDLRVYVLVTSYVPLKAWLYREGFARFSNTRFSLSSIDDQYVHLTNVAVQKTAPDYDPEKGCKWQMHQLRRYLTAKHASSQEDFDMKYRLLEDTLHVVDMEGRLTGKEKRIGGYDLMWNDGPVYKDDGLEALGGSYLIANTHLGCVNDREKQLQQILKPFPGQKKHWRI